MEYASLTLKDSKIRRFMTVLSLKIEWTEEYREITERFQADVCRNEGYLR